MATPLPDFAWYALQFPDDELDRILAHLLKEERDYLVQLGQLTKFRPVALKTRVKMDQHRRWWRKFAKERQEFAPAWLLAYGVTMLGPIEEAGLAKLPIRLREQLGYEPTDRDNPPTGSQIAGFLREAEAAYGLELARQWGNILMLLMEPDFKGPVWEALTQLGWGQCVPEGAPTVEEAQAAEAAADEAPAAE